MDIFHLSVERYSLDIHLVKYEELIEDMKKEVCDILKFMDLKWDESTIIKNCLNRVKFNPELCSNSSLYKNAT